MTEIARALYEFYSSFGIPAYVEGDVPETAQEPYITYTLEDPGWMGSTMAQARVWYRDTSYEGVLAKADEIAQAIGEGVELITDNGSVMLDPGTPYMQRQPTDEAPEIKVIYINLEMSAFIARKG